MMDKHPRGPRTPLHEAITQELINELVHKFYDKIQNHEVLGPIFNDVIQDQWPTHLERMCTFWGSVALKTGAYKGRPVPKHIALKGLTPEHFKIWLNLFRETAIEVCGQDIGLHFIDRAEKIAESLQLAIFFEGAIAPRSSFKNGVLVEPV
jgi:hemoglobin